jgi:hypothetical protein
MKITLTNDFHGTSINLILGPHDRLSLRQVRRAREALCGTADCQCGGPAGERGGSNPLIYLELGADYAIVDRSTSDELNARY